MSFSLFSKIDGEAAALVPILNEYNILQIVVCFIAFVSFTILNPSSLAVVYYILKHICCQKTIAESYMYMYQLLSN